MCAEASRSLPPRRIRLSSPNADEPAVRAERHVLPGIRPAGVGVYGQQCAGGWVPESQDINFVCRAETSAVWAEGDVPGVFL